VGSGTFSLEENQLRTDLQLINGDAHIVNRSLFDLAGDQGKFKLNRFEGVSEIKKIDLSPWHPKLGWVTSKFMILI
jgi:hypothetical protein